MSVRVNKDAFNIREKLSELDRDYGLKGSEIAAAETTQDVRNLVSAGRKNLIINGDMRIAQRGTFGTKNGSSYGGYLSVDRWAVYYHESTIEQTDVTINGQPKKACKTTAAGTNGRTYVYQKIENASRLIGDGTPFSISFWARASKYIKRTIHWRYYDHGTENNASNQDITKIEVGTEWKHYKIENVSLIDPNHNTTRDGGLWLFNSSPYNTSGDGLWFEFTEVQVELGSNATEFEHRSYGEELALCQRYYWQTDGIVYLCAYGNQPATYQLMELACPSTMTRTPNVTYSNEGSGTNFAAGSNSPQTVHLTAQTNSSSAPRARLQAEAEI